MKLLLIGIAGAFVTGGLAWLLTPSIYLASMRVKDKFWSKARAAQSRIAAN